MFRYSCTTIDENELRFWVLNHNLISDTPEFYREEVVFIDTKKLVDELVAQYSRLGLMPRKEPDDKDKELNVVYQNVKDHILGTKIDNLIEVLHIFKRNSSEGLIGERELRRVLTEYL